MNITLGGLKKSESFGGVCKWNVEITLDSGLVGAINEIPKPEPDLKVELDVDVKTPTVLIMSDLRVLAIIEENQLLTRENTAHRVGSLLVLPEGVHESDDVGGGELGVLVEGFGQHLIVVDAEFVVGVVGGEVEDHVVAELGGVGVVVELCYLCMVHVKLKYARLNNHPEYQDCDDSENDEHK
ncbi:uncharacterized protein DS421_10g311960 [Arachis hypogaea]|nr:uncharacterized protein DS421_10g311960 [Arachis hypogaea]